jgi:pescadillo protein
VKVPRRAPKTKTTSADEEKRLAETVLTRKNKRLYDMIKRKEDAQEQKQQKLQTKKKALIK